MKMKDERLEERHTVQRFERLTNSASGNARWEMLFTSGYRRRTLSDTQAGLDVTGIVDGIQDGEVDGRKTSPGTPIPVVLTVDGYGNVRGVRINEEVTA